MATYRAWFTPHGLIQGFSTPSNISKYQISHQSVQQTVKYLLNFSPEFARSLHLYPSFLVLKTDMENVIGIRYKKKYLCKKLGGNRVTYGRERICCLVQGLGVHFGRFDRVSHYQWSRPQWTRSTKRDIFVPTFPKWKISWRPKKAKICLVMIFAKTDCRDQSVNNFRVGANIGESLIVLPTFQFVCVISKQFFCNSRVKAIFFFDMGGHQKKNASFSNELTAPSRIFAFF